MKDSRRRPWPLRGLTAGIGRTQPLNIEDFRNAARHKLPAIVWAFVESAAADRRTCTENETAFQDWRLRQRSLGGFGDADVTATMAGVELSMPLALAAVGGTGAVHWTGDIAAARAAEQAGTRMTLSTASSYSIEEVAEATDENHWFQLYPLGGVDVASGLVARAQSAGYTALFVTVDSPVVGNREGERRWGAALPPKPTGAALIDLALHPAWLMNAARHGRASAIETTRKGSIAQSASPSAQPTLSRLSWSDIRRLRDLWPGRFYVKGILDPDDADRSINEVGADGVVVSNHGGRQLDRTLASIDALPAISKRIGARGEIYLDGGIRRAEDIVTALCLGAQGVFIGRPFLYGLATDGEAGILKILHILRDELRRCLTLMGCPSVRDLNPGWLLSSPRFADGQERQSSGA